MDKDKYIELLYAEIDRHWRDMAEMSDSFAAEPEVSGEEFKTSRAIVDVLEKSGFDVEYPFMGIPTAFIAKKGKPGSGGKVALLVEYDALPDIGHACGHNLHGSMSVLAGLGLLPLMKDIPGELLVVGTPAEETNGAKVEMAEKGVFDGCDFAIMIHSHCGKTIVKYRSLAMDAIEFTFKGKTSHAAAAPWEGINALNGLQLFFHAIDMLRQHVKPDVRMHGIYYEGGTAPNIVPERAKGRFYFRAPKRAYLDQIIEKVCDCARGAALATGTEVTWRNFEASFKDMLPNQAAEELLEGLFAEFGIPVTEIEGFMGSSDVGDVSYKCPAVQPEMDICGRNVEAHTREFAEATTTEIAHEALRSGAKIIARSALEVLLDEKLRERMWEDYKKEIEKGREH
ncbi:MAG TPA: M20 family metallopeptidase [Synergistaceae bacterium]|nr:M20 family metallopeptidase [Synergistaceae bacterium]HQA54799.1 M20 family metallopeptidase [Synergistaceae bacterium]